MRLGARAGTRTDVRRALMESVIPWSRGRQPTTGYSLWVICRGSSSAMPGRWRARGVVESCRSAARVRQARPTLRPFAAAAHVGNLPQSRVSDEAQARSQPVSR